MYVLRVKKSNRTPRRSLLKSPRDKKILQLKKCLSELKKLHAEAVGILHDLLESSSGDEIPGLCARFHILQEYFVMRYNQAKAYAISALGHLETSLSLF
jgi:hypothetical protein